MSSTKQLLRISLLSALLVAVQVSFSFIPNLEFVTLIFIALTLTLPLLEVLLISFIFSLLQALIYGFHTWVIFYFIIWPFLIIGTKIINKKSRSIDVNAIWAIIFSLLFGFISALIHGVFYGRNFIIPYWFRGLYFDIFHAVTNYIIVLTLLKPLTSALRQLFIQK